MKVIEQNETYQTYSNDRIASIPKEKLYSLLNLILIEAGRNMGVNFDDKLLDAFINTIEEHNNNMPLCYVASAIYRGSLGFFGAGRLIPKTIFQWLREVALEYERDLEHKKIEDRLNSNSEPVDLKKYPMGSALIQKVNWLTSGAIDDNDYDMIDLKQLAEMIGRGELPTLEKFNITNKNT